MAIYSRSDWGAALPKYKNYMSGSKGVFIHHSAGPETQTVRQIQDYHMGTKGWSDIAYSWLVDNKGNIYEGRGWGVVGGHTLNYNSIAHAVCFIGNTEIKDATDEAKLSINLLIAEHDSKFGKGYVLPHREANGAATLCPGAGLTTWLKAGRPTMTPGRDAMIINDGVNAVIGRGDTDGFVYEFQELLIEEGFDIVADGDFGAKTEAAAKALQARLANDGLYTGVVDGIWGPKSNEAYIKSKIIALYVKHLGRTPESDKVLQEWFGYATSKGIDAIETFIVNSEEYAKKNAPVPPVVVPPVPPVETPEAPPVVVPPVVVPPVVVQPDIDIDALVDQVIEKLIERLKNL